MRYKIKLLIGIILMCECFLLGNVRAEINEKPSSNAVPEIMTIGFRVDAEGGMYQCPGAASSEGGCRYAEYISPLLKSQGLKKLILVAEGKYAPSPVYDRELLTLYEEARGNQKLVHIKSPCSACNCEEGMTSDIYDYQDKDVKVRTSKEIYVEGEEVSFTITNTSDFDRYFLIVSAERLINGEWNRVARNVFCVCGSLCSYVGYVEQGKDVTMTWRRTALDNGCVNAPAGRYRLVVLDLYGWKDKSKCERYNSVVYSDIFEIKE